MGASDVRKLDWESIREYLEARTPEELMVEIRTLQTVVYVMVGGGMIGRFYAEQPKYAYVEGSLLAKNHLMEVASLLGGWGALCLLFSEQADRLGAGYNDPEIPTEDMT